MQKRLTVLLCLVLLALSLGGCTKCGGWIWERGGRVCHGDAPL